MTAAAWRAAAAVTLLGAGLLPIVLPVVAAGAQDAGTFSGTAVADGVRVNVSIPSYLLVEDFVDGGGPSAQAVLDSLGVSRAFASFPYPGELGVAATGLISTLTGFSLPSYPLIANSTYPTEPERDIDQPGFHLNAASQPEGAIGDARFGETTPGAALEGGGFSHASVTRDDDGTVVARAESRFSLVLGPVALRGVRAVAQVTRASDGETTPTSSLEVGSLEVAGVELELTERGLVLAGAPLVPMDAITGLTSSLTLGTTTLTFLPATVTEDSVLSAGLEIVTSQDLPGVGHPLDVTYRLGNVLARATSSAFDADAVPSLPLPDAATIDLGAATGFDAPALQPTPVADDGPSADPPALTARRIGNLVARLGLDLLPAPRRRRARAGPQHARRALAAHP